MTAPIRSMPELVDAIRARRDELNISHETIDSIAGLQAGYSSKLLGPIQLRGFSHMSLGAVLGALGIGLVVVEDAEQKAKVQGRWQCRKRPQRLPLQACASSIEDEREKMLQYMRKLGSMGGKIGGSKGGKRRAKLMSARARQRAASHAARMRWSKTR